jgi:orotate phosphoribosyltransferase
VEKYELAAALYDVSHLTGRFVLRSGRTTSEYFDKYRFESDPALLGAIAERAAGEMPPGVDVLAGLELGGVPIATALSLRSGFPVVFVRKQAKTYGTSKLAEGVDIAGRNVLVVEDVITSGGQVALSTLELRKLGAVVTDVLCVVDREEGGVERLAEHGLKLHALFTAAELKVAAALRTLPH